MTAETREIVRLYRKRARLYDFSANLYYLIGFREQAYRKRAVRALELRPGDSVVDIGCGTGLNFSLLRAGVGEEGRIVGVDLNDAMLGKARERVRRAGWKNVELVESDAARYDFPEDVSGVVSTFALTLVPEYDEVIRRAAAALPAAGRFVLLDLKAPEGAPLWLVKLAVWTTAPFGTRLEMMDRRPWESLARHLRLERNEDLYFGFAYLAVASKPGQTRQS